MRTIEKIQLISFVERLFLCAESFLLSFYSGSHYNAVFKKHCAFCSIVDPHFVTYSADPYPGFWWPKIVKFYSRKKIHFFSKITIYLSPGLYYRRPSYKRSLQTAKRTNGTSKHEISFTILWVILPSLIRIRIPNAYPDPSDQNKCGDPCISGSTTLALWVGNFNPNRGARNIFSSHRPARLPCSLATQFQNRFLESIPRPRFRLWLLRRPPLICWRGTGTSTWLRCPPTSRS